MESGTLFPLSVVRFLINGANIEIWKVKHFMKNNNLLQMDTRERLKSTKGTKRPDFSSFYRTDNK